MLTVQLSIIAEGNASKCDLNSPKGFTEFERANQPQRAVAIRTNSFASIWGNKQEIDRETKMKGHWKPREGMYLRSAKIPKQMHEIIASRIGKWRAGLSPTRSRGSIKNPTVDGDSPRTAEWGRAEAERRDEHNRNGPFWMSVSSLMS